MNVCIFSSATQNVYRTFIQNHFHELKENGIHVILVVLDENREKKDALLRHSIRVAKRQAKYVQAHWLVQYLNILFFRLMTTVGDAEQSSGYGSMPDELCLVQLDNLNSERCVREVQATRCDVICLMGSRIITKRTLNTLGEVHVVNCHSSDPSFVRGGPTVFWEILAGKNSMVLTVHKVVPEVDAGPIHQQKPVPIHYQRSLRKTIFRTLKEAEPLISELFRDVLIAACQDKLGHRAFTPGPIRVTPSIFQTCRAALFCRRRSGSSTNL